MPQNPLISIRSDISSKKCFSQNDSNPKIRKIKHYNTRPLYINCEKTAMKYPRRNNLKRSACERSSIVSLKTHTSSLSNPQRSFKSGRHQSPTSKATQCETVDRWLNPCETKNCVPEAPCQDFVPLNEVSQRLDTEKAAYVTKSTELGNIQEQTVNHEIFGRSSLRKNLSLLKYKQICIRTKEQLEKGDFDSISENSQEISSSRDQDLEDLRLALGELYISNDIRNTENRRNFLIDQESNEITLFRAFS